MSKLTAAEIQCVCWDYSVCLSASGCLHAPPKYSTGRGVRGHFWARRGWRLVMVEVGFSQEFRARRTIVLSEFRSR